MKTISDMTDAELSAAVAEEVWGWKQHAGLWLNRDGCLAGSRDINKPDVTLRLLEWLASNNSNVHIEQTGNWIIEVEGERTRWWATAPTLARALAQIALRVAREKASTP